jgi:hypothetical protein
MFDLFNNSSLVSVLIYRGAPIPANRIFGPVSCDIQDLTYKQYLDQLSILTNQTTETKNATHKIFFEKKANGEIYKPHSEDYLVVTGSSDASRDGAYSVKEYGRLSELFEDLFERIELSCRYLGDKKPGDTSGRSDNDGNISLKF